MAALFGYFPFDDSTMTENDWSLMFQWMRTTGILSENDPLSTTGDSAVAAMSGMTVQVYPGEAWIQGFYFYYIENPLVPGNYTITISNNPDPDPRIDLIVLRLDVAANLISYETLEGVPDPAPIPPVPQQNDLIWELPIAQIAVASGAIVINSGDITDERVASVQGGTGSSAVTLTSAGGTATLVSNGTGPALEIKGLDAGLGISLSTSATAVTIASSGPGGNQDICIISRSTDQTISASSSAAISFDTVEYDPNSMYSGGAPTRVTIATDGIYLCSFTGLVSVDSVVFSILLNGATTILDDSGPAGKSRAIELSATDYLEVIATNTHGVSDSDVQFFASYSPIFQVMRIG